MVWFYRWVAWRNAQTGETEPLVPLPEDAVGDIDTVMEHYKKQGVNFG